jgi:exopolysaccharide/PEP-CTERM locus tyrosine autokinase
VSLIERAIQRVRDGAPHAGTSFPAFAGVRATRAIRPSEGADGLAVESIDAAPEPRRVVAIDRVALADAGLLPPPAEAARFARQYRRVKFPLIEALRDRAVAPRGNLILIASALPGEGKTFTATNLALSLARERDVEVLLVDGDVAKPQISAALGLGDEPGLIDALADASLDVASLIVGTDVRHLGVLPAGRAHEDSATELLSSARMKDLLARLVASRPNRLVVFDSPPLLATTESHVLARLAGQIVLVVRSGETPRAAVLAAVHTLGDHRPIGVVLNHVRRETAGYHGYGAYGGYGRERADDGEPVTDERTQ